MDANDGQHGIGPIVFPMQWAMNHMNGLKYTSNIIALYSLFGHGHDMQCNIHIWTVIRSRLLLIGPKGD